MRTIKRSSALRHLALGLLAAVGCAPSPDEAELARAGNLPTDSSCESPGALAPQSFSSDAVFTCAGDFDEDGWVDFVASPASYHFSVRFYRNETSASPEPLWGPTDIREPRFTPGVYLRSPQWVSSPRSSLVCGDFNGDAHMDVVVARCDGASCPVTEFDLHAGNGDGTFRDRVAAYGGPLSELQALSWSGTTGAPTDYDGDGDLDIVWAAGPIGSPPSSNGGEIMLLANQGGTFRRSGPIVANAGFGPLGPQSVAVADFDGDGQRDLVAGGPSSGALRLYPDLPAQTYVELGVGGPAGAYAGGASAIVATDFDRDGRVDVLVSTDGFHHQAPAGGGIYWWANDGDSEPFSSGYAQRIVAPGALSNDFDVLLAFDYDHDPLKTPDLVATDGNHDTHYFVVPNRRCDPDSASGTNVDLPTARLDLGDDGTTSSGSGSGSGSSSSGSSEDSSTSDGTIVCDTVDPSECGRNGPRIAVLGAWFSSQQWFPWLQTRGSATLIDPPLLTDELLSAYDVVIPYVLTRSYSDAEARALERWVRRGGGLVLLEGYGPLANSPTSSLAGAFELAFGARVVGDESDLQRSVDSDHPAMCGVDDFVWVGGLVVDDVAPLRGFSPPVAWVDPYGSAARVQERGLGRVFAFGDEWISYDSMWTSTPDTEVLWTRILDWVYDPCRSPACGDLQSDLVVNGRFDGCALPGPGGSIAAVDGWNVLGPVNWDVTNATADACGIGLSSALVSRIEQVVPTTPGRAYQLRFDVTGDAAGTANQAFVLKVGATTHTFTAAPNATSRDRVVDFIAATSSTTVTFQASAGSGQFGPRIDNVEVGPLSCDILDVPVSNAGQPCTTAAQCTSDAPSCSTVPLASGRRCSECSQDAQCGGGGCTFPNPYEAQGAYCNDGELGEGCESDAVCDELSPYCTAVLRRGAFRVRTCGECRTSADCGPSESCEPTFELETHLRGGMRCVPNGSLPDGAFCASPGQADAGCQSGLCSSTSLWSIFTVGVCGECIGATNCNAGQSCSPASVDSQTGMTTPSSCL